MVHRHQSRRISVALKTNNGASGSCVGPKAKDEYRQLRQRTEKGSQVCAPNLYEDDKR